MRTAIISDVHGNYPALLSVIEDAEQQKVDHYVFIGDYIFDLPYSNEVVNFLIKMGNAHIIKGNKEQYMRKIASVNKDNWTFNQMGAVYQTLRELSPHAYNFLNNMADETTIHLSSRVSVYAIHTPGILTPLKKNDCSSATFRKRMLREPFTHEQYLSEFSALMNTDECKAYFEKIDASVITFGHTHLQSYAHCGTKLIINPGSCGQPLDFDPAAAYTIVEDMGDGYNIYERRVSYDIETTISESRKTTVYEKGKIWCDLVFLALRTGRDYFGTFFDIAEKIAVTKNETGEFYSNATWDEANDVFLGIVCSTP